MAILSTVKKGYMLIKTATGYVKLLPRTLATLVSMADGSTVESQITTLKSNVTELNRKLSGSKYADGYVLVNCGSLPNNSTKNVDISFPTGVTDWWVSEAWFRNPNLPNFRYTLPHIDIAAWSNSVDIGINNYKQIVLTTTSNWTGYNAYAIVSYKL